MNINIHYNSINLTGKYPVAIGGTSYFAVSAGIGINNASIASLNIYNNVIADSIIANSSIGTTTCYGLYSLATLSAINYNDYYINGTGANIGLYKGTPYSTYTAWKAVITSDVNSITLFPYFNNALNLTPLPTSNLLGKGVVLSSVGVDLKGVSRSATFPTIGAYESALDVAPPTVIFTNLLNTPSLSNRSLNAVITDNYSAIDTINNLPRLYYKKLSAGNDITNWKYVTATGYMYSAIFTIDYSKFTGGVAVGDTIQYFIVAKDGSSAQTNITISSGAFNQAPSGVDLSANAFPISGAISSYALVNDFSGVKTVGIGGNYTSLTGANGAFYAINNNYVTGDITLKITSDLSNETGAVALNAFKSILGSEKIFIVPDGANVRTISGVKDASGLIRFVNTKNVVIDGSFNGSGRYLQFNNSTSADGATIQIANSAGATSIGCRNIVIKNSNIVGPGGSAINRFGIYIGDLALTPTATMADNDSITIDNNKIYRGYYLVYTSGGAATRTNDYLMITNNLLAGAASSTETNSAYGIYSNYSNYSIISGNTITGLSLSATIYGIYQNYNSYSRTSDNTLASFSSVGGNTSGIYHVYGTKDTISNNTLSNLYTTSINLYGIYNSNTVNSLIFGNSVKILRSSSVSGSVYGIYNSYYKNLNVFNNLIDSLVGVGAYVQNVVTGIYNLGYNSVAYNGDTLLLANNSISSLSLSAPTTIGGNIYGIYISAGKGHKLFYNSVHLTGSRTTSAAYYPAGSYSAALCLDFSSSNTTLIDSIFNNNFSNFMTLSAGNSYSVYVNNAVATNISFKVTNNSSSNYNNLYSSGNAYNFTAFWNGLTKLNLSDWQSSTSQDGQSINVDPQFVASNLLVPTINTNTLIGKGVATSIKSDIIGDARILHSIGAYENHSDLSAPKLTYTSLDNTVSTASRLFDVTMEDETGVNITTGTAPRLYYKKSTQANDITGWQYVEGVISGSATYLTSSFTIDYSKLGAVQVGDMIQYFIVAQDTTKRVNFCISGQTSTNTKQTSVNLLPSAFPIANYSSYVIMPEIGGNVTVGNGGNYTTLTGEGGLFYWLNNGNLVSDLTVKIISDINEPGTYDLNTITRTGGDWNVNIVPDGSIVRVLSGPGKNTSDGGIFRLTNVKNVTIDGSNNGSGRYLTFTNTLSSISYVIPIIQIAGPSAGKGCSSITVKNCNIKGSINSGTIYKSYGIYVGNSASFNLTTYADDSDNDSISIINNNITKAHYGIVCAEGSGSNNDNILIKNNIVGSTLSSDYISIYGMYLNGCANGIISGNEVMNVIHGSNSLQIGIYINQYCGSALIEKNIIHGISVGGYTSGNRGEGITLGNNNTCSYLKIYNNSIYDINGIGSSSTTTSSYPVGINIDGTHSGIQIYHNSINLSGNYVENRYSATSGIASAALKINSTATRLDVKNNIFVNTLSKPTATSGGSYSLFVYSNSFDFSNSYFDYNNYYSNPANPALNSLFYANGQSIKSFGYWQNTITQNDFYSITADPLFNSSAILNLSYQSPLITTNRGLYFTDVPNDMLDSVRGTPPTIGAYEKPIDAVGPTIAFAKIPNNIPDAIISLNANISDNNSGLDTALATRPVLYYKKTTQLNNFSTWKSIKSVGTAPNLTFNLDATAIGGFNLGDTIQYFIVARDLEKNSNYSISSGMASGVLTSTALTASNFPINGITDKFILLEGISGIKTVGLSSDFKSLTSDTNGVFKALNSRVITGDLTFKVTSDLYESGANELDYLMRLNNYPYSVKIIPSDANVKTISGAYTGALIRLQSINGLSIDGSVNGSGQYLKFVNNASVNSSTFALFTTGSNGGCKNISLKNCIVVGPNNGGNYTYAIFAGSRSLFGNPTSSLSVVFYGNNDSINIENCWIYRGYNLIFNYAEYSQYNNYWTIKGNTFGASSIPSENNTPYGLYLYYNKNCTIVYNSISGLNATGVNAIYTYYNDSTTIYSNIISNISTTGTLYAMNINNSSYNKISKNRIKNLTGASYYVFGIEASSLSYSEISKNSIANLTNNYATGYVYGIENSRGTSISITDNTIDSLTSNATGSGSATIGVFGIRSNLSYNGNIERNTISRLTANTIWACGIYYSPQNSATDFISLNNNSISIDATKNKSLVYGIFLSNGKATTCFYNSVKIFGSRNVAFDSYALYLGGKIDSLCNNSLTNTVSNSNISFFNYALFTNTTFITVCDFNNLWADDPSVRTNNYIGYYNAVRYPSLTSWSGVTGFDLNSISEDPLYVSASLMPSAASPLLKKASIVSVSNDIVGSTRIDNAIGCYDKVTDLVGPSITLSNFGISKVEASKTIGANIVDASNSVDTTNNKPRLYYKKSTAPNDSAHWQYTEASGKAPDFTFVFDYSKIGGVVIGDIIQYFVIAQDTCKSPSPNVGINSAYSNFDFSNVKLNSELFPLSGYNSFNIVKNLSGIKTIGANGDYSNLTGTNGAFVDINNSILVGDLTLKVISDISETATKDLNLITRDGGDWKINIVPSGDTLRTISGIGKNSATGGIIRFIKVRNVNIDGSFNRIGRYLTFTDNVSRLDWKTPIIQISDDGTSKGCSKITIQNCNIQGQNIGNLTTAIGLFIGHSTLGNNELSDNDSISIINNVITRAHYGIIVGGSTGANNDNLLIKNNTIGSKNVDNYIAMKGIYLNGSSNAIISGNEIMNISNNSNITGNSGINIQNYCDSAIVENNIIHGVSYTGTGAGFGDGILISGASSYLSVINNSIFNISGTGSSYFTMPRGIAITGASVNDKIYYNSVYLNGEYASSAFTTVYSAALLIGNNLQDSLDVRNNLFANYLTSDQATSGASYAACILSSSLPFANCKFDNNNYYSNPNNTALNMLGFNGGDISNLSAWQTSTTQDVHSKNVEPDLYSDTLLMPNINSALLYSADTTVDISVDISGNPRSVSNPTIGAYEKPFSNALPNVLTNSLVNNILQHSAQSSGIIVNSGGSLIIAKGMVIDIAPYPNLTNYRFKNENGPGLGDISAYWTGLQEQMTYYVRAYASNFSGTSYGSDVAFTTLPIYLKPFVLSSKALNITKNSANLSGEVQNDYYSTISERGFIWGTKPNISLSDYLGKIAVGIRNNSFVSSYDTTITGLSSLTDYNFKAYAINGEGVGYGIPIAFTTLSDGYQISGTITYAQYTASVTSKNMYLNSSKKMPFAPYVKLMQNGVKVDSVVADANTGAFAFNYIANGQYTLEIEDARAWPTTPSTKAYQLNIQDVALIRQCAAQVRNFDSLQIKAVNVNLDYKNNKPYFNVQDVSFIRMKNGGVNPSPQQWMMPNWVYGIEILPCNASTDTPAVLKTDMTVSVNGSNQSFIIRCIGAADVNGQ